MWMRLASSSSSFRLPARQWLKYQHQQSKYAIRCMSAQMIQRQTPKLHPKIMDAIDGLPDIPYEMSRLPDCPIGPLADPNGYELDYTAPVTSAHMIDGNAVSTVDSVAVSPDGKVVHGRYGPLNDPAAAAIPLEYLALLKPAAEGAAAVRTLGSKQQGTILVYGASTAPGMSVTQLANTAGHTVISVVSGNHSGNDDMMFCCKNLVNEPGTAVPEEFAINKSMFRDLVQGIAKGDEGFQGPHDRAQYLTDFKDLLKQYSEHYPDTRPAAVDASEMEWKDDYMEKDREEFEANMGTYLSETFIAGAPPVDEAKLDAFFTPEQYEIFRQKFWHTTTLTISGVETPEFNPPLIVRDMCKEPEDEKIATQFVNTQPYCFSIFNDQMPPDSDIQAGGPILGAVICVTNDLLAAATAVEAAGPSRRAKAEALQFVTQAERNAYYGACSVVSQAGGAPVYVLGGSLPGLPTLEADPKVDVPAALAAMDIDEQGKTKLNFFVQSYRANDFPFYADYAVFRANEVLSGPRQIIVLK